MHNINQLLATTIFLRTYLAFGLLLFSSVLFEIFRFLSTFDSTLIYLKLLKNGVLKKANSTKISFEIYNGMILGILCKYRLQSKVFQSHNEISGV